MSEASPSTESRRGRRDRSLRFTIVFLLIPIVVLVFFRPFRVHGASMEPSLNHSERILVSRMPLRIQDIDRGDVVVFRHPAAPHLRYVKRVIALPGDWVEIEDGAVLLNNEPIDEPYLLDELRAHDDLPSYRVPEGHYFVLGDHRSVSSDSRAWGSIPTDAMVGKAVFRYWPPHRVDLIE